MAAAQRANQAGNKIIYSRESLQKENTLGKAGLLFQQFYSVFCHQRELFIQDRGSLCLSLSPKPRETKKYRLVFFQRRKTRK